MRITKEQDEILENFKCERLSSSENNKNLIQNFKSEKGKALVRYLKEDAWEEDSSGKTAWYLIKSPNGNPCLFFALKCGALFQPLGEDMIKKELEKAEDLLSLIQDSSSNDSQNDKIISELEQIFIKKNMSFDDIKRIVENTKRRKKHNKKVLDLIEEDKKKEGNRPIQRVRRTFSGVELTHFCTDDNEKKIWDKYDFRFPMGEVLFWKYIAPIFINIQKFVGCEYAFLFAADTTIDGTLINYYNVSLKFSKLENMGTNKPFYDICCEFMSQDINSMKKNREAFFENFNIDEHDEII